MRSFLMESCHRVCKPPYLLDKAAGLQQKEHPAEKWGDDGGGPLISPVELATPQSEWSVAESDDRCVYPCYVPLHHKSPEEDFFRHPITWVVPEKNGIKQLRVGVLF